MLQKKNRDNKRNTMKKWFIYAIHNIFNYQGRARRAEFVGFQFINYLSQMAIIVGLGLLGLGLLSNEQQSGGDTAISFLVVCGGLLFIYQVWMFLVSLSITARRLHDLGWSGWWQLVIVLPTIVISIFLMIMQTGGGNHREERIYLSLIALYALFVFGIFGILFFKEGKIGANEYGEDPKAEERIVQPFSEQIVEENNVNR